MPVVQNDLMYLVQLPPPPGTTIITIPATRDACIQRFMHEKRNLMNMHDCGMASGLVAD